ncbi:hypothetical protein KUF83_30190 [Streptomyces sp. BV286]|uniref:hypothetical protein n=1 Tax=Streptomyces sp. BV286 TaxID=2849672 RepID=UPI001C2E91F1|nr:hypothetical protein [Streptomyces sp. BV286]MBV1940807.1 hypothetical protein [Streptomyces sp. BV286]
MPATRSRKRTPVAPQAPVEPAWHAIEEQVWAAAEKRKAQAVRTDVEARALGSYLVLAHTAYREDGSEFWLSAHLTNPHGCMVASLSPLDESGTLWRHRVTYTAVEVARHVSLMDAANAAALEAVERGAWSAVECEDVEAAYAARPRPVLCEACGR